MNSKIAKEVINVIKKERRERSELLGIKALNAAANDDWIFDQWMFTDEPFINDMCLMVLVALRHSIERELVSLAARANAKGPISNNDYRQNLKKARSQVQQRNGWKELYAALKITEPPSMKTLRLLANCIKHEPTEKPGEDVLSHLDQLDNGKLRLNPKPCLFGDYAPLPESGYFRERLAESVELPKDADYCTIAERFVKLADNFLKEVRQKVEPARITGKVLLSKLEY